MAIFAILASLVTLSLKFYAYFLTGSIGIYSDALETFINLGTSLLALAVLTIAAIPADDNHHYGHDKIEYFSSGIVGSLILMASIAIIYHSAIRIFNPQPIAHIHLGLIILLGSTLINWLASYSMLKVARKYDSITLEADAKHLLTDVWTSVGVMTAMLFINFFPKWYFVDPLIGLLVAVHIFITGIQLVKRSIDGLMDIALPNPEIDIIKSCIEKYLPKGTYYRRLRTRKSGARRFIDFVIMMPGDNSVFNSHDICLKIEEEIQYNLNKSSITIRVEPARD